VDTTKENSRLIMVLEDIEETRDGIEELLKAGGYRVAPVRSAEDAILKVKQQQPDLMLVSLPGPTDELIQVANQIRQDAGLNEDVPIVIFCIEEVATGEEVAIGDNVYLTRLDNFNQLRRFMHRLLKE